ncbi:MAG TPA: glycosyltransferase family 4 protein [Candidatus Nanoarchaeia archaeon]|nr:glycosyltransferase family 4 protein [Candidatus Nanoarchaeia archaeon]
MKIAFVYDAVYPYVKGGGEKRIYDVARELSKNHEVHVFGMKYWRGDNKIIRDDVTLHGVCKAVPLYAKSGRRSFFQPIYFSFHLARDLFNYDFDIVECENFPYFPCFVSKAYCLWKKKPLVIMWIEVWRERWRNLGIFGYFGFFIEWLCFRLTKHQLVLSPATAKHLPVKSKCIPVGVDLEKIKKVQPSSQKFDILFVGRLIPEKGVDILINAVKDLPFKVGIIGDGPERAYLQELAENLQVNNVSFLGILEKEEEVYGYMKSSNILVLPSEREGFGLAALEAIACGCKVITTDSKYNYAKHLVGEKFLCKRDVNGLRKAIQDCIKIPYSRKILLRDFDIKHIAEIVENYFLSLHEHEKLRVK